MDKTKDNFLSRVKIAIFKFEEYEKFLVEIPIKAVYYYIKLIICFSLIITIAICFSLIVNIKNTLDIINNEFPNFKISENQLEIDNEDEFELYIDELNLEISMNENANNRSKADYTNSIELLKNKMALTYMGYTQEVSYEDIDISKDSLINYFESNNLLLILLFTGIIILLITFCMFFIMFYIDILLLSLIGMAINIIIRIPIKFREILKIATYSMTLPIILYLLYSLANILFGTTIEFFPIAYNSISYIYLITVLLILKSNLIKNTQELQKILEVEKDVKKEIERQKQEEKEKQEENDKEKKKEKKEKEENKGEPQGEPGT